jgi:hypothetical protein
MKPGIQPAVPPIIQLINKIFHMSITLIGFLRIKNKTVKALSSMEFTFW